MAKKSKIAKNEARRATMARYAARRAEPKAVIRDPAPRHRSCQAAQRELRGQPRDASPTRIRNRDSTEG